VSHTASPRGALPSYSRPPVVELIFAVALVPLTMSLVDLAQFGLEELGENFPVRQDQPPARMTVETFDDTVKDLVPSLALLMGAPPVRLCFQSEDKTRLVQLQRDWLAYNWQVGSAGSPYPRYRRIEEQFIQIWDGFSTFVNQHSSEVLTPQHSELSYINHITPDGVWERPGELHRVLRLAGNADRFLPEAEDGQFSFRYRISHEGADIGRLYVSAAPGQRQVDRKPVIQLTLTARGGPLTPDRDGMLGFPRLAHEWMVNSFAAVTTSQAQELLWGRIE
jgi:uncharacterized protein (TIGR04255 family)